MTRQEEDLRLVIEAAISDIQVASATMTDRDKVMVLLPGLTIMLQDILDVTAVTDEQVRKNLVARRDAATGTTRDDLDRVVALYT